LSDHTTADDASRYRDDAEVTRHWPAEPVARLRRHLIRSNHWDKNKEEALLLECGHAVEQAADECLATPPKAPSAMFDHIYASLPTDLAEQREAAIAQAPGAP
jgi:pyruvate dehydrogenase E1 component alpha subunit